MKINFKKILTNTSALFLIILILGVTVPTHQAKAKGAGLANCLGLCASENTANATSISTSITGAAVTSLASKEVLDGIAWQIAKQMVSSMTKSLVNWINSGFQGSPAFITDLNGMLLDALDTAAGEYIKSLGANEAFLCSPFKLDVQAALSINYAQAKSGMPSGPTAPSCKLSDITNNIKNFLSGISSGGPADWFQISSSPQNTPYGAYLEAEAKLNIRLKNEAGQQITVANWGQGFLSKKFCEDVEGGGINCRIGTPGTVIGDALKFQLSTGPRSLIQADEINEIIGALINQLTLQAMNGINGLLGLGGNSNYTDYNSSGQSYLDQAVNDQVYIDTSGIKIQIDQSLATENSYFALINSTIANSLIKMGTSSQSLITSTSTIVISQGTTTTTISGLPFIESNTFNPIVNAFNEATEAKPQVTQNITDLTKMILDYNTASATASTTKKAPGLVRQNIVVQYIQMQSAGILTSPVTVSAKRNEWTASLK